MLAVPRRANRNLKSQPVESPRGGDAKTTDDAPLPSPTGRAPARAAGIAKMRTDSPPRGGDAKNER